MNILDLLALFTSFHEYSFHNFTDQHGITIDSGVLLGIMSVCLFLSRHCYLCKQRVPKRFIFSYQEKKKSCLILNKHCETFRRCFLCFHHINWNISRKTKYQHCTQILQAILTWGFSESDSPSLCTEIY